VKQSIPSRCAAAPQAQRTKTCLPLYSTPSSPPRLGENDSPSMRLQHVRKCRPYLPPIAAVCRFTVVGLPRPVGTARKRPKIRPLPSLPLAKSRPAQTKQTRPAILTRHPVYKYFCLASRDALRGLVFFWQSIGHMRRRGGHCARPLCIGEGAKYSKRPKPMWSAASMP
jgi:hypothetical protein